MKDFIVEIINEKYKRPEQVEDLIESAYLLRYLDNKTESVDRNSKSRGSFANIYAIYVLVEDYLNWRSKNVGSDYLSSEGMKFTDALKRTRELPFGKKIQNHALNNRCNSEFEKFFHELTTEVPIIRDSKTKHYWINEKLLEVEFSDSSKTNIAQLCIEIIKEYVRLKIKSFEVFFEELNELKDILKNKKEDSVKEYFSGLLEPNSDARIFEIVSYVIIKYHYITKEVSFKYDDEDETVCKLTVYKTGRTNANDGGIDYIMIPLGRIFQVTEVLDFKKYFLDIDKLIYYPITFVVKKNIAPDEVREKISKKASEEYPQEVLEQYLRCIDEIITIPTLKGMLDGNIKNGFLSDMIDEIINQCKVEYNLECNIEE